MNNVVVVVIKFLPMIKRLQMQHALIKYVKNVVTIYGKKIKIIL
jgi:hypothetical protein